MFVLVDLGSHPPVVSLEEPDDTRRFQVTVRGGTDRALVFGALVDAAAGRLEGDDAWITVDAIRRLAPVHLRAGWDDKFSTMLDYARTKGWLDEATHSLQAHIEWPDA